MSKPIESPESMAAHIVDAWPEFRHIDPEFLANVIARRDVVIAAWCEKQEKAMLALTRAYCEQDCLPGHALNASSQGQAFEAVYLMLRGLK